MATDYSITIRASPFFLLVFQNLAKPFLNVIKVINQTHAKKRLTAFVNMFQVFTGKLV